MPIFSSAASTRIRMLIVSAGVLLLTACPVPNERESVPPSVERAEALARSGDQASAARAYAALAGESAGEARNRLALAAARAYLAARDPESADRALALLQPPLGSEQTLERSLIGAELALARGAAEQAWQQLGNLRPAANASQAARYFELQRRAAFATGRVLDGVLAEMSEERSLPSAREVRQARRGLLGELREAAERGVRMDPGAAPDATARGWLELAPLAAASARNRDAANTGLDVWLARYSSHPARDVVRADLLGQAVAPIEAGAHVALLLPLTGRQAAAGASVRDGFMTGYYQQPVASRPRLRVYDTGDGGAAEALVRAVQEGAELIVGPLTREEVGAAARSGAPRATLLALNFLPPGEVAPANFYQFALSPEDEAREVARRVLADGHRRGVLIAPTGEWGTRVSAAFRQELESGGGGLIATAGFDPAQTDFSESIMQVLRLSDSRARHRRLEAVIGTKLQFEPRRRGDIEFIFAPAPANLERLLRPQLRFHYAGGIPTYATSDAFEPDQRANEDLEGLMFSDMPWMLGSDLATAVRAATREAWPAGGPRRGRLFAFGFDALRLAMQLRARDASSAITLDALTGRLSIDTERRVHRELMFAQLHNGEIRLLPNPAAQASSSISP